MESLRITDDQSKAVQKTDKRITLDRILGDINSEHIDTLDNILSDNSNGHVTICVLTMKNGFVVLGKSAPMDPANFNKELGQKFAREDAIHQLWPLYAFAALENESK